MNFTGKVNSTAPAVPTRSLSFDTGVANYLKMTPANFGAFNLAKWAISLWYKRSTTLATKTLYGAVGGTSCFVLQFDTSDRINFQTSSDGSTTGGRRRTTASFSDTASWHNILAYYDSANATAGNRMRLWYDGTEITSFGITTNPSSGIEDPATFGNDLNIGGVGDAAQYDGLIYQPAFFSGTLPAIGSVYNSGHPVNVIGDTGLWSLLNTNASDAITKDYIISSAWTNVNTVTKSTDIPT